MKRYRFLGFSIDATRNVFRADMPPAMKERLKKKERSFFESKYGTQDAEAKFERWLSIPKPTLSVVGEHTHLLDDIERAYVAGGLYAALTGACCLGERIFNHIILRVRESYKTHPHYKHVYSPKSFNKWNLAIDTLKQWEVINDGTEKKYQRLHALRTETVHFQDKDQDLEPMAKEGIELINEIISDLFGIGPENKFISWCEVPGEIYLRKEYETVPFVREFYLPNAVLVGYKHTIANTPELKMMVRDDNDYTEDEISDTEFVKLRTQHTGR